MLKLKISTIKTTYHTCHTSDGYKQRTSEKKKSNYNIRSGPKTLKREIIRPEH